MRRRASWAAAVIGISAWAMVGAPSASAAPTPPGFPGGGVGFLADYVTSYASFDDGPPTTYKPRPAAVYIECTSATQCSVTRLPITSYDWDDGSALPLGLSDTHSQPNPNCTGSTGTVTTDLKTQGSKKVGKSTYPATISGTIKAATTTGTSSGRTCGGDTETYTLDKAAPGSGAQATRTEAEYEGTQNTVNDPAVPAGAQTEWSSGRQGDAPAVRLTCRTAKACEIDYFNGSIELPLKIFPLALKGSEQVQVEASGNCPAYTAEFTSALTIAGKATSPKNVPATVSGTVKLVEPVTKTDSDYEEPTYCSGRTITLEFQNAKASAG